MEKKDLNQMLTWSLLARAPSAPDAKPFGLGQAFTREILKRLPGTAPEIWPVQAKVHRTLECCIHPAQSSFCRFLYTLKESECIDHWYRAFSCQVEWLRRLFGTAGSKRRVTPQVTAMTGPATGVASHQPPGLAPCQPSQSSPSGSPELACKARLQEAACPQSCSKAKSTLPAVTPAVGKQDDEATVIAL